jgi:hypothetical protein
MKNPKATLLLSMLFICCISERSYSKTHLPRANKYPSLYATSLTALHSKPSSVVSLVADLYAFNADSSVSLEDGTTDLFDPSYCNCVNWLEDVKKLGNVLENFSLIRDGKLMAIEKQQPVGVGDTIYLSMSQMQHKTYEIGFVATGLNQPNLAGFVQDVYAGTSIPLNLNGNTQIPFTVTTDPNSARPDRFRIVFTNASTVSGVTPVTYTDVKALQNNNNVNVQWQVDNELNVSKYEVEKSSDGTQFTSVATIAPSGKSSSTYNWVDATPSDGVNYYRIEEVDDNGVINYSEVVAANVNKTGSSINVYPNPVISGVLGLQMDNMASGNYSIHLINNFGQTIFAKHINHEEGNTTETIVVGSNIAKGVYRLLVISPDNSKSAVTVVF